MSRTTLSHGPGHPQFQVVVDQFGNFHDAGLWDVGNREPIITPAEVGSYEGLEDGGESNECPQCDADDGCNYEADGSEDEVDAEPPFKALGGLMASKEEGGPTRFRGITGRVAGSDACHLIDLLEEMDRIVNRDGVTKAGLNLIVDGLTVEIERRKETTRVLKAATRRMTGELETLHTERTKLREDFAKQDQNCIRWASLAGDRQLQIEKLQRQGAEAQVVRRALIVERNAKGKRVIQLLADGDHLRSTIRGLRNEVEDLADKASTHADEIIAFQSEINQWHEKSDYMEARVEELEEARSDTEVANSRLQGERDAWKSRAETAETNLATIQDRTMSDGIYSVRDLQSALEGAVRGQTVLQRQLTEAREGAKRAEVLRSQRDELREDRDKWRNEFDGLNSAVAETAFVTASQNFFGTVLMGTTHEFEMFVRLLKRNPSRQFECRALTERERVLREFGIQAVETKGELEPDVEEGDESRSDRHTRVMKGRADRFTVTVNGTRFMAVDHYDYDITVKRVAELQQALQDAGTNFAAHERIGQSRQRRNDVLSGRIEQVIAKISWLLSQDVSPGPGRLKSIREMLAGEGEEWSTEEKKRIARALEYIERRPYGVAVHLATILKGESES